MDLVNQVRSCAHEDVLAAFADELSYNHYREVERRIEEEKLSAEDLETLIQEEYIWEE